MRQLQFWIAILLVGGSTLLAANDVDVSHLELSMTTAGNTLSFQKNYADNNIEINVFDASNKLIESGDQVSEGTALNLMVTVKSGKYQLKSFQVSWVEGGTPKSEELTITAADDFYGSYLKHWTMKPYDTTITLDFEESNPDTPRDLILTIEPSANGLIELFDYDGVTPIASGSSVKDGSVITVKATPDKGYKVSLLRIGDDFYSKDALRPDAETGVVTKFKTVKASMVVSALFEEYKPNNVDITVISPDIATGMLIISSDGENLTPTNGVLSIEKGKQITIMAIPMDQYAVTHIKVGSTEYTEGHGLTIGDEGIATMQLEVTESTTISVLFDKKQQVEKVPITIAPCDNGSLEVLQGERLLSSGDQVDKGSCITVKAIPNEDGYETISVTIGDKVYEGDALVPNAFGIVAIEDIIITEPTTISALFRKSAVDTYKVTYTFPSEVADHITVKANGEPYLSGTDIAAGTDVVFTYTQGDSKWCVDSWIVDGNAVAETKDKALFILTVEKDTEVGVAIYNGTQSITQESISIRLIDHGATLVVNGLAMDTPIWICDTIGRTLLLSKSHCIDISIIPRGVYIVRAGDIAVKVVK